MNLNDLISSGVSYEMYAMLGYGLPLLMAGRCCSQPGRSEPFQPLKVLRYATYKSDRRSAEAGSPRASSVMISSRPSNNVCAPSLWACVKTEAFPLSISVRKDVKNRLAV